MNAPIRFGILGAADFARRQMGPAIHAAKGAKLAALATSSAEKAKGFQAFAPDIAIHQSYETLLADPDIDAVYIPLPNHLHVEWTKKALQAGKHVLCEKPIALKAEEIDELIALRDATGLIAAEAYMIVHHPQWQRARALLAEGAIGKLSHTRAFFSYNNPNPQNIRNQAGTGGGGIRDIGVYTYGSVRFATGQEPLEITAADITWENGVDVTAHIAARFAGFSYTATTSTRMANHQEVAFHGDQGVMRLTAPFNAGIFGEAQIEISRAGMADVIERFPDFRQYEAQVEGFVAAIKGEAPFAWSLENARATQAMIDAIFAKAGPAK
ncbi:MAG: Gfo/Idh/MocA family protein [Paracoccaceae bacterium]